MDINSLQASSQRAKEALDLLTATHARLVELWQEQPDGRWASAMWTAANGVKEIEQNLRFRG